MTNAIPTSPQDVVQMFTDFWKLESPSTFPMPELPQMPPVPGLPQMPLNMMLYNPIVFWSFINGMIIGATYTMMASSAMKKPQEDSSRKQHQHH